MTLVSQLLIVTEAFCRARRLSLARVSTLLFNDGKKLPLLIAGGDLYTGSFERALTWLSDNWPETTPWPGEVPRPEQCAGAPQVGEGGGEAGGGEAASGHGASVPQPDTEISANGQGDFA